MATKKNASHPAARGNAHAPTSSGAALLKPINLALQGGGSHGAFTWGVIDRLLEDGCIGIDSISATSAGAMNAVAVAFGSIHGPDGARQALQNFWKAVSDSAGRYNPMVRLGVPPMVRDNPVLQNMLSQWFNAVTHAFAPQQLNPLRINPLRDLLLQQIDFDQMNRASQIRLFLAATNVRSGKVRVFGIGEPITADMVLASACLPQLFPAVEVDGEHYWDGGFMGNPVLFPLFYHADSRDVLIVHINPIVRRDMPTSAEDILDRVNEITFNSSLIKELRAVHFVQKLMDDGWIKDEYIAKLRYVLMHSLRSDDVLTDLPVNSKMRSDWEFLTMLRDRGRAAAGAWLEAHFDKIGVQSSVDLRHEFL